MKKISKAAVTKAMIAASAALCLVMGQNCAQPQFQAIDGNGLMLKDAANQDDGLMPVSTLPVTSQPSFVQETPVVMESSDDVEPVQPSASGTIVDTVTVPVQNPPQPETEEKMPETETSVASMTPPSSVTDDSGKKEESMPVASEQPVSSPVVSGTTQESRETASTSEPKTEPKTESTTSSAPQTMTPPASSTASSEESEDDCLNVEKIEKEHLPKVATLDEERKPTKILVCHMSGQSGKSHELLLPATAVRAHLAHHGDYLGACGQPAVKSCQPKVAKHEAHEKHEGHDKSEHHEEKSESTKNETKDKHQPKNEGSEQARSERGGCKDKKG